MVNRIIITDGDWSADNIRLVPRGAYPLTVGNLDVGDYYISNTRTKTAPVAVTSPVTPDNVAPTIAVGPTLSGNTEVGSTLTLNIGSANGSPAPTPTIRYTRNGNVLTGQDTNTLNTAGFSETDAIVGIVRWESVAGFVEEASNVITLTVANAEITAITPITPYDTYETQTIGDIPNVVALSSANNFQRTGRTIVSAQLMVGQMVSVTPGQPEVLSNLVDATPSTVLFENDIAIVRVTDSGGQIKDFTLTETQYAESITLNPDGSLTLDINTLVPANEEIPVSALSTTVEISRNDMLDGEELFIAPTLTGTAAVNTAWTIKRATWAVDAALPMPTIVRTMRENGVVIHTFDAEDFDPDTFETTWTSPSGGAGKSYVYHEDCGGSTAQTAPIAIPTASVTLTNLGLLSHTKGAQDAAMHPMGNVTVPASGDGYVVVRGTMFRTDIVRTFSVSVVIGGVPFTTPFVAVDYRAISFVASIPRSSLPSGVQAVEVTPTGTTPASIHCRVSVDFLAGAGAPGTPNSKVFTDATTGVSTISVDTAPDGMALGVVAQRDYRQPPPNGVDWTGLTEDNRDVTPFSTTDSFITEFASHATTTTETPRTISVTNFSDNRNAAIAIFFPKA